MTALPCRTPFEHDSPRLFVLPSARSGNKKIDISLVRRISISRLVPNRYTAVPPSEQTLKMQKTKRCPNFELGHRFVFYAFAFNRLPPRTSSLAVDTFETFG